jgi:hypothetical protein
VLLDGLHLKLQFPEVGLQGSDLFLLGLVAAVKMVISPAAFAAAIAFPSAFAFVVFAMTGFVVGHVGSPF